MHISEFESVEKVVFEKGLGDVRYVLLPTINRWTEDVIGSRWEPRYNEEQKDIIRQRMTAKWERAEKRKVNRDEFAKDHFGFDQDRIDEATQFYSDLLVIQDQENEIADLERKIKELKENNLVRQKRVMAGDPLIFKDLASDGCDKIKKANEALKENGLTRLCYGELNRLYKLFKEIMG